MSTEAEALAGLTILVAVAKADGVLAPEERRALEEAVDACGASVDLTALVGGPIDLDAALAVIQSDSARRQVYVAAAAMALADRVVAPEEDALLARLRAAWGIGEVEAARARRLADIEETPTPEAKRPRASAVVAPAPREAHAAAEKATYRAALVAAAFGAIPFPFFPDVGLLLVQRGLVETVAAAHGHTLDRKGLAATLGATVGLTAMRTAVVSVMKLVPVWGSVAGATSAFVATWALGMSVHRTLAEGESLGGKRLSARFETAKTEGKRYYDEHRSEIDAAARARTEAASAVNAEIEAGELSPDELDRRVAEIE